MYEYVDWFSQFGLLMNLEVSGNIIVNATSVPLDPGPPAGPVSPEEP